MNRERVRIRTPSDIALCVRGVSITEGLDIQYIHTVECKLATAP